MSKPSIIPLDVTPVVNRQSAPRRRAVFAGLAVVIVLALAYFDGGEEPIHPISQQIAVPQGAGNLNGTISDEPNSSDRGVGE